MENTYGITSVGMQERICAYCPFGEQWYCADIKVVAESLGRLPDYMEVTEQLNSLNGQTLIIEDLVERVHEVAREAFGTTKVKVSATVPRGKHLPVVATKESD